MTFAEWVKTDAEKLVRIDLKAHNGTTTVNRYIASAFYRDRVNSNDYDDRLRGELIIRRSLGGAFSQRAEATVGAITIDNSDESLNDWLNWSWSGWPFTIRLGDPSWAADDSRWSVRFEGLANKIEAAEGDNGNILTLFTRDKGDKLDRPIVQRPLNMHVRSLLRPFPLSLGKPQNVTVPMIVDDRPPDTDVTHYCVNAWDVDTGGVEQVPASTVYENGAPTTKSTDFANRIGGGEGVFEWDVADPEGRVTADPYPAADDPVDGSGLNKAGEIMDYLFSYTSIVEAGIARGGTTTTVQLDENASTVDDFYNAPSPTGNAADPGYVAVFKRDGSDADSADADDYDGSTRTLTLDSALSFTVEQGDQYVIVLDTATRYGALTASEVDSTALSQLDTDAPYDLGIFDEGGRLTYLNLMDEILPATWWRWQADGTIGAGLLKDPSSGTSAMTIDQYETRGTIRFVQEDEPIFRARVGYNKNWTVMETPQETVTPNRAAFLAREYDYEVDEDLSVLDQFPEAAPRDWDTYILSQDDARTEAQRLMGLFGVARQRFMIEGLSGTLALELHDVVTLKDDVYGLENGKDFRVVMMEERPIEGTCDIEVWG